jgi:lysophospholipase
MDRFCLSSDARNGRAPLSLANKAAHPNHRRGPILIIAAGQDELVSTPAIDEFSVDLRTGAHLIVPGARHDLLMEQDRFRRQALAAFDAFVPGTPLFA